MRRLSLLFVICVIVLAGIAAAFVHDAIFLSPKQNATPVEMVIVPGSGVSVIANQLKQSNLITHPTFFKWFVMWSHTENKLQAGTFLLVPNSSIASIVLALTNPKSSEVKVTIPEGFTNDQIKEKLNTAFVSFDAVAWNQQTEDLQGYLFPDTYQFSKEASVKDVVEKMRSTLDRRLAENEIDFDVCEKYDSSMGDVSPFRCSLRDTIILASIIEKEVQSPEDMKHVAGILFNRLAIGMPLQVDSTLTFVNKKTSATLTTEDLKMNSLYNTYTHRGLPPGPICNPGMNAILAVLHPTDSQDIYFLTTKDGRAVYAKTHDQHVANKQKYLK